MSMRKDREITIVRESNMKSSRMAGRLSVSLTEALLGDSLDPLLSLHEGSSINEDRAKLPGGNKENGKYLDRHPKFREFAANQSMNRGSSRSVSFDIDGIPDNSAYLSMNQNGIIRAFNGKTGQKEAIKFRSDTYNKIEEPALEITPDAPPQPPQDSSGDGRDEYADDQRADDAATRQAAEEERLRQLDELPGETDEDKLRALLPEFEGIVKDDSLNYYGRLDKWLETYKKALGLSKFDDRVEHEKLITAFIEKLRSERDSVIGQGLDDTSSEFNTNLNDLKKFMEGTTAGDSLKSIVEESMKVGDAPLRDLEGEETDVDLEPQGDPGPLPDRFREEEGPVDGSRPTEGPREDDGNEDSDGAGDDEEQTGGGGQPPSPPTGNDKELSDYIDKVAVSGLSRDEVLGLSENRRPLHKRSLIDLLYSS